MTDVTGAVRDAQKLERIDKRFGIPPDINTIAEIQAIMAGVTNLATAKDLQQKLLVSLLTLRARVEGR